MFLRRTGCTSLEREEHTKQALAIGALEFKTPRYLVGEWEDWELGKNSFELPPMSNPSCHNYHWQFEHLHWMLASATHSIYVSLDSKLLVPVVYFADTVKTSLGIMHTTLDFCPRPTRK